MLEISDVKGDRDPVKRFLIRLHPVRQIRRKHKQVSRFRLDYELAIEAGSAFDRVGVGVDARVEELDRAAAPLRRHAGIIDAG